MKLIEKIDKTTFVCDGCDYLIGLTQEEWNDKVKLEDRMTVLKVPWDVDNARREDNAWLEFHFHSSVHYHDRRDCFRYWAHNPKIMQRSLESRELPEDEIEEFMSQMLYRSGSFGPGLAKEVKA